MAYSIPPVSLDDLRAFEVQHFIVPDVEAEPNYEAYEAQGWEEFDPNDEDDLGYYNDGVKRTLTDEQIKIFRHTEIQTLLRERRQKAEAEAERAENEAKDTGEDDDDGDGDGDDATMNCDDAYVQHEDDVSQGGDSPNSDRRETDQQREVAEEETRETNFLEYRQPEPTRNRQQGQSEGNLAPPVFSRRIVTYDD